MCDLGDAYLEAYIYVRLAAYGKAGAEGASSIRRGAPENGGSNASPLCSLARPLSLSLMHALSGLAYGLRVLPCTSPSSLPCVLLSYSTHEFYGKSRRYNSLPWYEYYMYS